MKGNKSNKDDKAADSKKIFWKKRPSEIRGYMRTLYATAGNGDYVRVDYHTKEKKVRLYIEDSEEGGISYYSLIINGKIAAEKDSTTGRSVPLSGKISQRAELFSSIGNREVLRLINNNYGIASDYNQYKKMLSSEKKKKLEETRKRYFKPETDNERLQRKRGKALKKIQLVDIVDFLICGLLCSIIYFFYNDFVPIGIVSSFFGILIGFVDMYFRKREPVFIKILLLIVAGISLYIYGYYFR